MDWNTGSFPCDGYFIVKGLLDESIGGDCRPVYVHSDAFTWGFNESDDPEAIELDSTITRDNVVWKRAPLKIANQSVPEGATDFTDDGFKVTYYRRCKAFNMNLLEAFDGTDWKMCSYLPWAELKPVMDGKKPKPISPSM